MDQIEMIMIIGFCMPAVTVLALYLGVGLLMRLLKR